jgi:heme/copper-type cytochrome/quinol oxidase subunit 3
MRGWASPQESARMRVWVAVEQTTRFVERVATLMVELSLAAAVIFGAVFVGHELREWRDWYWAAYLHPAEAPASEVTTEP